jgi:hypothetical protein
MLLVAFGQEWPSVALVLDFSIRGKSKCISCTLSALIKVVMSEQDELLQCETPLTF